MGFIADSAIVDPRAEIAPDVQIGPFCVVGPLVSIGPGTKLENNVTVTGRTTIGADNQIYPGAVIGAPPQDFSYRGGDTRVVIGDSNVIRESVTINRATEKEQGLTAIGDHCFLMACCHIAHDCLLGDGIVISNGTLLGGHVHIHDHATLSGGIGVHHFTTIGAYSFVGGLSRVLHDVPPYLLAEGSPARPRYINLVGLRRHGFSADAIESLLEAFRLLYRSQTGLDQARELLRTKNRLHPAVNHLLTFLQDQHEGRRGRAREIRRAA